MSETGSTGNLVMLSDTGQTVADPEADVRGRAVVDRNGEEVGEVDDLLVDDEEYKVRFLRVGAGGVLGIGKQHFLVPVDAVERVGAEELHINRDRTALTDVPVYDPELTDDPAYYTNLYGWWGFAPYWGPGYLYPGFPYLR